MEKPCKLIVMGGSAGSISALVNIIPLLPPDFPIPILVVLHRQATSSDNFLAEILQRKTDLRIKEAEEKEALLPGTVYLAPADYHVLLEKDFTVSLDVSEKVNYSRPSIDVTFFSAAAHCKSQLIGILLTGANQDGAQGMVQIAQQGGITIAQDPTTAEASAMPAAAIQTGCVQYILSLPEIVHFLTGLAAN